MKCAMCGNTIDKKHPFTNPKSHKRRCPIYVDTKTVANVIIRKATIQDSLLRQPIKPTGSTEIPPSRGILPKAIKD